MNITFIIGNGFDLQNKLETSFLHFFDYVTNNNEMNHDNPIYMNYKKSLSTNSAHWANFEKQLGKYTFNLKNQSEADNFIDDLTELRNDFIEYMKIQEKKFNINEDQKEDILKRTYEYFYSNLTTIESHKIRELISRYNGIKFHFINFNYTNTLSNLVDPFSSEKITINKVIYSTEPVLHIHKTLKSGTFLGLDNMTQLNSDVFRKYHLDSLIKPNSIREYGSNDMNIAKQKINLSKIIYIFGMAIGDTDKTWWQVIGDWLNSKNQDRYLIINKYYGKGQDYLAQHPHELLKFKHEAREDFLKHLSLSKAEKAKIEKRIYISIDSRFIFNAYNNA